MFARSLLITFKDYWAQGQGDSIPLGPCLQGLFLGKPLQVGQGIVTSHLLPKFMDLALERSPTGREVQPTGGWNMILLVSSGR